MVDVPIEASNATSKWENFARTFGMNEDYIRENRENIAQLNMEELNDAYFDILNTWRNCNGNGAAEDLVDKLEAYYASVAQARLPNTPQLTVVQPINATLESDPTINSDPLQTLVIGSPECPYSKLVTVFSSTDTFLLLEKSLADFARWLDLSPAKRSQINRDLQRGNIRTSDAIELILLEWKEVESNNATLLRLLNILEENRHNHLATCIKNAF